MKRTILPLSALVLFNLLVCGQVNLNNGLHICYPLDGNSIDFSGNSNDGTLYGPVAAADRFGNPGKALFFNGASDYISINNQLPDGTHFSISVWVNHTNATHPSCILSDADDVLYNDLLFNVSDDGVGIDANKPGGTVNRMDVYPLGNYNPAVTGKNLNNAWHHLVWVCDQDSQKIYIDTVLAANLQVSGSNMGYHNLHPSIGRLGDGVSNGPTYYFQYFSGMMDEFKFYTRALDFADVKALYTTPAVCGWAEGVTELSNHYGITMFPNPATEVVHLKFDNELKQASFIIYDILGKEIKRFPVSGQEAQLDISEISHGAYIYKLVGDSELYSKGTLLVK